MYSINLQKFNTSCICGFNTLINELYNKWYMNNKMKIKKRHNYINNILFNAKIKIHFSKIANINNIKILHFVYPC